MASAVVTLSVRMWQEGDVVAHCDDGALDTNSRLFAVDVNGVVQLLYDVNVTLAQSVGNAPQVDVNIAAQMITINIGTYTWTMQA